MANVFFILWLITTAVLAVFYFLKLRAERATADANQRVTATWEEGKQALAQTREFLESEVATAQRQTQTAQQESQRQIAVAHGQANAAIAYAQQTLEQRLTEFAGESERVRQHYETEAFRIYQEANAQLEATLAELAPLRGYASLQDAESEVRKTLADAIAEAAALRREAQMLVDQTKEFTAGERTASRQRAADIRAEADAILAQATRDAARIAQAAEDRAEQVGGDAYVALRDKQTLEQAVAALWNIVQGYGDKYVIPTRSSLDELAADFDHTKAGQELKLAREQSRRLVELNLAATCNYEEEDRRDRANRFVVDAFNGRVDAILSRTRHDNYGTLERELRDAFSVVNLNGLVFRDARILPTYLDTRLAELKWAVVTQELRAKEREEQRAIQERIREEEKARRDYERAIQEAAREEAAIKQAIQKAHAEAEHASAEERERFEAQLAELTQRLGDAEAKGQRALSMAQQTRAGNVYVISNVGSFGEGVLKIGMTRRLIPEDRIKELGDASVPFAFDVHAMIQSDDAPSLERMLHHAFEDARVNKVNYRKEFFRVPLERLRALSIEKGFEVTFTMAATAREFRETVALEKMTPDEREKYHLREIANDELVTEDATDFPEQ